MLTGKKGLFANLATIYVALTVSLSATAGVVYTDDMEAYSTGTCDAAIGNWKYREYQYGAASCSGAPTLVYPDFSQAAAQLQDKFACNYYNIAGVVPGGDANAITGKSLAIADHDENVSAACHRIQAAVELASGATDLGEGQQVIYTFEAKVKSNQYGDNSPSGADVGILFVVLDIDAGYSVIIEKRESVVPSSGSVSKTFEVNLEGKSNILVQAGFYAQADDTKQAQAQWDDMKLSWAVNDSAVAAAEAAACADTSVLRFEDAFGNAKVTCRTDTYEWPTGAEDWAGFGDTKRGGQYPFYFPRSAGSISFDCSTQSGTAKVRFKLENAPFPSNESNYYTSWVDCGTTSASKSVSLPAGDTVWGNLLLYVGTKDVPVSVKNVQVNGSVAAPIPVLPVWALLGLVSLIALAGFRRR